MKKQIAFAVFVTASLLFGAAPKDPELERIIAEPPQRSLKIAEKATMEAFRNGKNNLEIVVPADSTQTAVYAGKLMAETLGKALGSAIPVVKAPSEGKVSVILGDCELSRKAGIDVSKLPRDGFFMKSSNGKIHIAGRDEANADPASRRGWSNFFERGTLNGALDFLERFADVRFFFPGEIGTVIPKRTELILPEMDLFDRPDMPRRRIGTGATEWLPENPLSYQDGEAMANYIYRMESFYVANCHGLSRLKYSERFEKTHPEYFALDPNGKRYLDKSSPYYGVLCYGNPAFAEEVYRDASAFLHGKPASERGLGNWDPSGFQKGFFNIMPHDWGKPCQCEFCKGKSEPGLIWDLVFNTAERLAKDNVPGYVTAMSYSNYTEVPNRPVPENLLIMVAVQGPWDAANPGQAKKYEKRIADWRKACGRNPWLWTYTNKYGGLELPGIPAGTPRVVGTYFEKNRDSICGAFLESETDKWLFNASMYYVFGKVMWNSKTNVNELMADYYSKLFGPAAKPMGEFFDRVEELWTKKIAGRIVETETGPQAIPPSGSELWGKIFTPEQMKAFEECFARAEKLAASDKESLARVEYFRKYYYAPLAEAEKKYRSEQNSVGSWKYFVPECASAPTIDGKIDDETWKNSSSAYLLPFKADSAEVNTWFKAARDAKNLYLAVRSEEPLMNELQINNRGRDNASLWQDSGIEIFLNPSGDGKDAYHWIVNADGDVYDSKIVPSSGKTDDAWNSKAEFKTEKDKDFWTLECAIPLEELGTIDPVHFSADICRNRVVSSKAKVRLYAWAPEIKAFNDLENFGIFRLDGAKDKGNLIGNPDFALPIVVRSFGPWHAGQKDVDEKLTFLDREIYRSAGQSLRVTSVDGVTKWGGTQYLKNLKPNTKYRLSCFVRTEDVKPTGKGYLGAGGAVINLAAPGNMWFPKNMYQGTMPWTFQSWTFTSGPAKKDGSEYLGYIRLGLLEATGKVWFDNLRLEELSND